MAKYKEIKRNHHYVWSFYLKNWADNNELFYISSKGKISKDSVKGLAKETDFYKINPLNSEDVEFIKRWSSKSSKPLQVLHSQHLQDFIALSVISNRITSLNNESEELQSIDQVIKHNSLENLHSIFENRAVTVIQELSKGNQEILNTNDNMITFCSYLGLQISRTKSMKEKSLEAIKMPPMLIDDIDDYENYISLFEKNWWFLSFIFGLNIGGSLYESRERDNHIFITNNTGIPFITSDNPIINVHSSLANLKQLEAPTHADFYIPLSPRYAYMINQSNDYAHLKQSISIEEVNALNMTIFKKSYKNVFASERNVLMQFKAYNKTEEPIKNPQAGF